MGDRHRTPRAFASGSQKRKMAADRNKRMEEILAKTPKLTSVFSTSNNQETLQISVNPIDPVDSIEDEILVNNENNPVDQTKEATEPEEFLENDQSQPKLCGFNNDIGLWPDLSTEEMKKYWADKSSSILQNCDEELFKKSECQYEIRALFENVRRIYLHAGIEIRKP